MKALVAFHSCEGQTKRICDVIAGKLESRGYQVCWLDLADDDAKVSLIDCDLILLGASIRYGHFNPAVYQFINANLDRLNVCKSVFFGVNLTARKAEKNTPETNAYMRKFVQKSPWQPDLLGVFAGALRYSRYTWYDKAIIRLIMTITKGPTDTSQDVEFTDWSKVEEFAERIARIG